MKKIFGIVCASLAVLLAGVSCVREAGESPLGNSLSADVLSLELPVEGARATVNVTANGDWVSVAPDWIKLTPSHGSAGTTPVSVVATDNLEADATMAGPRAGSIYFLGTDAKLEVTVAQEGDATKDQTMVYTRVTSADQLTDGQYLIASNDGVAWQIGKPVEPKKEGYYSWIYPLEVTEVDGTITMPDASMGWVLTKVDGGFTLSTLTKWYVYQGPGYFNFYFATDASLADAWTIEVAADGKVNMVNAGPTVPGNYFQYDAANYKDFGAWATAQEGATAVYLYKSDKAIATVPTLQCADPEIRVGANDTSAEFAIRGVDLKGPWDVTCSASWITSYTKTGTGDGTIAVAFGENPDPAERSAEFIVVSDGAEPLTLKLTQGPHQDSGTAEIPYTVPEALAIIDGMEDGATAPDEVYVKGFVCSVTEISAVYGNGTFLISENGSEDAPALTVFRCKWLNNENFTAEDQIKVGYEVVMVGKLQRYVNKDGVMTPELSKGYVYSVVEVEGEGTEEHPFNVEACLAFINDMEDGETDEADLYVWGVVTGDAGISTEYGNATFKLTSDGSPDSPALTVFRAKWLENEAFTATDQLKDGDLVVLVGKLQRYVNKDGVMTPELSKGHVVSVNGSKEPGGDEPGGDEPGGDEPGGDEPGGDEPAAIVIDGEFDDWDAVFTLGGNGTHVVFKVTSDANNIYFYTWRAREGRFNDLFGAGVGYIYFAFDLDGDPANGVSLNGNGPYDYIGYIYCFGGSADAPTIEITADGACAPAEYTVANVQCKGKVTEDGAFVEYSVPRADLPAIPSTPVTVTSWGNKDLSKVQLTATL